MADYIDFGRNDPCPCGSGKKFKRCCRETVEKMMFHWNNRSRWPWMTPQLQKALAVVCGLRPGEGEAPPPVSAMDEALDNLAKKVFSKEDEDEFFDSFLSLIEFFTKMVKEEECFRDLRFPEEALVEFLLSLDERLQDTGVEPGEEEFDEIFEDEIESFLPRLIDRQTKEDLVRKLIDAIRREPFDTEKRSAVIFALKTCLESGANQVLLVIFRVSLSEFEFEDEDDDEDPGFPERSHPDPSWPVVRSFVPRQDVWNVCGFGSAGVIQEQPGGLWSLTMFQLGLIDGGLQTAFSKDDLTPEKLKTLLEIMAQHALPWQEGPLDLASRFVWAGCLMVRLSELAGGNIAFEDVRWTDGQDLLKNTLLKRK
ncbi:MAG: SEC-C domain-containing protein [Peptococcaceae bacterium]|nr:SEC-C domain-containing protein [Peptococcaceae bacterium]